MQTSLTQLPNKIWISEILCNHNNHNLINSDNHNSLDNNNLCHKITWDSIQIWDFRCHKIQTSHHKVKMISKVNLTNGVSQCNHQIFMEDLINNMDNMVTKI